MKKIITKGNLPSHLALFAKTLEGNFSNAAGTEFWEMSSVTEFEKKAVEVGYEIIPAMDNSTKRGFLVGFEVEEPRQILTLVSYVKLKIYFIETDEHTFNAWIDKIKSHRGMQQEDMRDRKDKYKAGRTKKIIVKETK